MSEFDEELDLSPEESDRIRRLARQMKLSDSRLEQPPAMVWDGIAAGLKDNAANLTAANLTDADLTDADPAVSPQPVATGPISPQTPQAVPEGVTQLRPKSTLLLAAAAAIVLIVGIAGVMAATNTDNGADPVAVEVLGEVAILNDGLPVTDDATGSAKLIQTDSGYELELDVESLVAGGDADYLELWVINADVTDMHSLGTVNGDGRYQLPEGVDPAEFPVVDISFEKNDGVAAHSGLSVLRGTLDV